MNSLETIADKIQDMKAERRRNRSGGVISGSSHVIQGQVVPVWDELSLQEEPHDGNLMHDWAFTQDGSADDRAEFD